MTMNTAIMVWKTIRNIVSVGNKIGAIAGTWRIKTLEKFDKVLGLNVKGMKDVKISIPKKVKDLVEKREVARSQKEWDKSDLLRKEINNLGYSVEDTSSGSIIRKI